MACSARMLSRGRSVGIISIGAIVSILLQLSCTTSFAQSIVAGRVIDGTTNQPLPFVDIYLAATSMGTSSDANGAFRLKVDNRGKYDLMASFLGYATVRIPILIADDSVFFYTIKLIQKSSELPGVVVRADTSTRKKDLREFKRIFLGESNNASACRIKNLKDIYVYFDKSDNVLVAYSKAPIVVENLALGYIIHYDLEKFEANYNSLWFDIKGTPRFEELKAKDVRQEQRWRKARAESYEGSLTHLMNCIRSNRLHEEGWDVVIEYPWARPSNEIIAQKINFFRNMYDVDSLNFYKQMRLLPATGRARSPRIHGGELLSESDNHRLRFKGKLMVSFIKERDERIASRTALSRTLSFQESNIQILRPALVIYDNGYFEPQAYVSIEGYLAWKERISDFLPSDFNLAKN